MKVASLTVVSVVRPCWSSFTRERKLEYSSPKSLREPHPSWQVIYERVNKFCPLPMYKTYQGRLCWHYRSTFQVSAIRRYRRNCKQLHRDRLTNNLRQNARVMYYPVNKKSVYVNGQRATNWNQTHLTLPHCLLSDGNSIMIGPLMSFVDQMMRWYLVEVANVDQWLTPDIFRHNQC